jgi:phosphoribosylaminoimidazolecarboxamide formyltransferase/IMP cyclohydrolase
VSDKTGVLPLARSLADHGVEIISTGGTAKLLQAEGVPVTPVSAVTGFPEIMDGRVKTLHPRVHAGLLAVRSNAEHMQALRALEIEPIDLVVVNLYPFKKTVFARETSHAEIIENIDIGGPSMLRAAAKNYPDVLVITDPGDYPLVTDWLESGRPADEQTRLGLAAKVFRTTAAYDALIAQYLSNLAGEEFPDSLTLTYEKAQDLRYGENPHQQAAFYREPVAPSGSISAARQLQGKELSFNNINDANAALLSVREFDEPAVAAIKHTNPCGVGLGKTILEAWRNAQAADPVSIFGGVVALNRAVDAETAKAITSLFLEIVIAPGYSDAALEAFRKKPNLRVLEADDCEGGSEVDAGLTTIKVEGGLLVQEPDIKDISTGDLKVVTHRAPTEAETRALLFAWKVVKHVRSNAIVLVNGDRTVGIGAGQMNRVGAAEIAIRQAGDLAKGAVMASDGFFPMGDTVELAASAGITAIIQPGGSIKDSESIAAAEAAGAAMVTTGMRHFRH